MWGRSRQDTLIWGVDDVERHQQQQQQREQQQQRLPVSAVETEREQQGAPNSAL